jgi:signal-transduction protein with cAMP-binding, CBS, and nucleotidyltransferase domain
MYLQIKVPFFEQYDRLTMTNICKQLKQKVYDRGEVIVSKGMFSDCMYVVLIGEAGVYESEGELLNVLTENRSIGERALRVDELTKYTVVAQKVSVCLSLQRLDFQKQVFHLEHELRISRFNYISSLPMT